MAVGKHREPRAASGLLTTPKGRCDLRKRLLASPELRLPGQRRPRSCIRRPGRERWCRPAQAHQGTTRYAARTRASSSTPANTMLSSTEVVVIGAGPNGLSVAAHLKRAGIEHRVFGHTMGAWRYNMPAGMMLKSEPYASDLSAPSPGFLARDFCGQAEVPYHERVIPLLPREQFIAYGSWLAVSWCRTSGDWEIAHCPSADGRLFCSVPRMVSASERPAWSSLPA